jgi:hypothetical protein
MRTRFSHCIGISISISYGYPSPWSWIPISARQTPPPATPTCPLSPAFIRVRSTFWSFWTLSYTLTPTAATTNTNPRTTNTSSRFPCSRYALPGVFFHFSTFHSQAPSLIIDKSAWRSGKSWNIALEYPYDIVTSGSVWFDLACFGSVTVTVFSYLVGYDTHGKRTCHGQSVVYRLKRHEKNYNYAP